MIKIKWLRVIDIRGHEQDGNRLYRFAVLPFMPSIYTYIQFDPAEEMYSIDKINILSYSNGDAADCDVVIFLDEEVESPIELNQCIKTGWRLEE